MSGMSARKRPLSTRYCEAISRSYTGSPGVIRERRPGRLSWLWQ